MFTTRAALSLLLAATLAQQLWYVSRAVLPAQDAVDYVSVAQRIEREGFLATVRAEPVPPLFPASVYAAHAALARFAVIEPREWGRAAQIAAACALIAAVVPAFLFARRLVDPLAAFCGTLVFFSLPEVARLGADGTSDALHLLFAAAAMWSLAVALEIDTAHRWSQWLLAGTFTGAALLVRSEMLVVAAVVICGIIGAGRRRPLAISHRLRAASLYAAGLLVAVAPLMAAGVHQPLELAERLRGGGAPTEDIPLNAAVTEPTAVAAEVSVAAPRLGKKDPTRSIRFHGFFATVAEFAKELAQASAYLFIPLACLGSATLRAQRGGRQLTHRMIAAAVCMLGVAIFVVAWRGGYLSSRHFLLPIALMAPYAGLGIVRSAEVVAGRNQTLQKAVGLAAASIVVACCLTAAREPTHASQFAHREAARWLNSPQAAPGRVLDQQGFTSLSTGRVTYRFEAAEQALDDGQLAYVVLERADLEAASSRGARLREMFGEALDAVARFADPRGRTERDVLVFVRPEPDWLKSPHFPPLTTATQSRTSHAR